MRQVRCLAGAIEQIIDRFRSNLLTKKASRETAANKFLYVFSRLYFSCSLRELVCSLQNLLGDTQKI